MPAAQPRRRGHTPGGFGSRLVAGEVGVGQVCKSFTGFGFRSVGITVVIGRPRNTGKGLGTSSGIQRWEFWLGKRLTHVGGVLHDCAQQARARCSSHSEVVRDEATRHPGLGAAPGRGERLKLRRQAQGRGDDADVAGARRRARGRRGRLRRSKHSTSWRGRSSSRKVAALVQGLDTARIRAVKVVAEGRASSSGAWGRWHGMAEI